MSEPKVCPFRPYAPFDGDFGPPEFGPCIKERCAAWRILFEDVVDIPGDVVLGVINAKRVMAGYEPLDKSPGERSYCGLAGKP